MGKFTWTNLVFVSGPWMKLVFVSGSYQILANVQNLQWTIIIVYPAFNMAAGPIAERNQGYLYFILFDLVVDYCILNELLNNNLNHWTVFVMVLYLKMVVLTYCIYFMN